jgi:hypothetical protein
VTFERSIFTFPEHWQDEARERAAIVEFCAGVTRSEAEEVALELLQRRDELLADVASLKLRSRKHGGPPR